MSNANQFHLASPARAQTRTFFAASLLSFALLASCGGSSESADAVDAQPGTQEVDLDRYFPIAVGASWSYEVSSGGTNGVKVQTVLALEDVGGAKAGTVAYKVQSTKPSGKITVSWQQDTGTSLLRHREQTFASDQTQETEEAYSPAKLRLDEGAGNLTDGATFQYTYEETVEDLTTNSSTTISKTEVWTVEAVDVLVTVPAGAFACVQIRKFNAATGSDKRYWFAKGVGKIREESASQTEELTTYYLP